MKKFKKFFLPSLIVAMFVIVSILLSKLFTLGIIDTKNTAKAIVGGQTAFFVSVDNFEIIDDAEKYSKEVSSVGGAGYVIEHNKKYHVIVSMYLNNTDATSVASNLKTQYVNVTVIELQLAKKPIENKTLAKDINDVINDVINFYITNAIKLDKNEISENNVLLKSLPINAKLDELIINLENDVSETSVKLRKMLRTVKNSMQLLTNLVSTSSIFKYMGINTYMDIFTALQSL